LGPRVGAGYERSETVRLFASRVAERPPPLKLEVLLWTAIAFLTRGVGGVGELLS